MVFVVFEIVKGRVQDSEKRCLKKSEDIKKAPIKFVNRGLQ